MNKYREEQPGEEPFFIPIQQLIVKSNTKYDSSALKSC